MKILLSPTKTLQFLPQLENVDSYVLHFFNEASALMKVLETFNTEEVIHLFSVSPKLAKECYAWHVDWIANHENKVNLFSAITMFSGEVYKSFDFASLSTDELARANEQIVILSGLYGALRPFDLIAPYRLEMKTKYAWNNQCSSLYQFWGDRQTDLLNSNPVLINLASAEYFSVLNKNKLTSRIITPVFMEKYQGKHRVVMMHAKQARGKMARYLIQNKLDEVTSLKLYNLDGYQYDDNNSSENQWCFVR